jgi:hypothetical protein
VASILTEGAVPANRDKILPVIVDRVTRFLTSPQNELVVEELAQSGQNYRPLLDFTS